MNTESLHLTPVRSPRRRSKVDVKFTKSFAAYEVWAECGRIWRLLRLLNRSVFEKPAE